MEIKVMKNILGANQQRADNVRAMLRGHNTLMLNLIGSPGCGKTTLLEKTLERFKGRCNVAVIEGDVASDRDARRIQAHDVPVVLINTDGACHLESISIEKALAEFDLDAIDIVFVENVGNLVCPAEFDIGEYAKIAVSSVAEGDDKPEKYPLLFREAKAVVLNKTDLTGLCEFNRNTFMESLGRLNGRLPVLEVSCRNGTGLEGWFSWIEEALRIYTGSGPHIT